MCHVSTSRLYLHRASWSFVESMKQGSGCRMICIVLGSLNKCDCTRNPSILGFMWENTVNEVAIRAEIHRIKFRIPGITKTQKELQPTQGRQYDNLPDTNRNLVLAQKLSQDPYPRGYNTIMGKGIAKANATAQ